MSCRFSLEHKNKPFPKSCPTCGLAGQCQQGFRQVAIKEWANKPGKPKYVILDGNGRPPKDFADKHYDNGIPASILIAQCKDPADAAHVEVATQEPSKAPGYGPAGCNVALRKNGVIPPHTCTICRVHNGGPFGSSELHARGCNHYHHVTGFGFVEGQATPAAERWVHPGDPGHANALGVGVHRTDDGFDTPDPETLNLLPSQIDYAKVKGPDNCTVVKLKAGLPPNRATAPCERCKGTRPETCCLFYKASPTPLGSKPAEWQPVYGRTRPERIEPAPESVEPPLPAVCHASPPRLSRVKRARCLDLLERYCTGLNDNELNDVVDILLTIICDPA